MPSVIQECKQLFRSEAMFLTLSNLTGLSLHPLAANTSDSDSDTDTETGSYTEIVPKKSEDGETKSCHLEAIEDGEKCSEERTGGGSEDSSSEKAAKPSRKRRKLNSGSEGGKSHKNNKSVNSGDAAGDSDNG